MEVKGFWHWVRHTLRLFALYGKMDTLGLMRSMGMLLTMMLSDTVLNIAAVMGMLLLAERFGGIGNWSKYQVLFLLGYGGLVDGIINVFFGYNVAFISRRLGRGQFDHTLIQPQPIVVSLLTEGFNPAFGLPSLLPGTVLLGIALPHLVLPQIAGWWFLFAINMVASVAVVLAFQFAFGSLAFRAPRATEEISSSTMHLLMQLKSFPLDGLGAVLTGSLLTAVPVGGVAWLPCRALLGMGGGVTSYWLTPLLSMVLALVAVVTFWKGLQYYGRVGSQRYSNFGHRN